ncbi:SDR family NAD(P)-dependent oxidoreductase [Streptomyces sp. NPDC050658]|uniref:SDR family NAD(P)-dependent oxidoreductase n=1 Tax=Streptomyces sp. NPDC050658 TaxID=3365633 RepID=UPI0037AA0611
MLPRDRGTIVQVGSALGERSLPLQSVYCGAKHAINGFISSLRTELLYRGSSVRVTVVRPVPPIWANRIMPALLDRCLARTGFDSQQTERRPPTGDGNPF